MERTNNTLIIKCPKCNYEYLPGEIYNPDDFLGQPKDIKRDIDGNIDYYFGVAQNLQEKFICEKCNKPFIVKCKMEFESIYNEIEDFDEDYSVPLYQNRITLN